MRHILQYRAIGLIFLPAVVSLIAASYVTGCGSGDDGADGPTGPNGEPGEPEGPGADALWDMAVTLQSQGAEGAAQGYWDRFLEVEPDTERAWLARYGLVALGVREVGGTPGHDQRVVFSPDGTMLAFVGQAQVGGSRDFDVFVMPADGSAPPMPVTVGGGCLVPSWCDAGQRVLFDLLYEETGGNRWIYAVEATGAAEPTPIIEQVINARAPVVIPGADRFLYGDGWHFFTARLDGSDRRPVPLDGCHGLEVDHPSVSADGKTVVFTGRDWLLEGGSGHIFLAPLDGSALARRLTHDSVAGRNGNFYPSIAPDGKRVIWSSDARNPGHSYDTHVLVVDDPRPPVTLIAPGARATWSRDGRRIAFDRWTPGAYSQIWIMELGGKRLPLVEPQ